MVLLYLDTLKVPRDRVKVIIGKDGEIKKKIEELGDVKLDIDINEAEVRIDQNGDPLKANIAKTVIQAISRGFNPQKAVLLFDDGMQFIMISLRDFARPGSNRIKEMRSRIIGTGGKTRTIIEELTGSYVSVYGDTVSIIGDYLSVTYSEEAINMIINGRKHRTVYTFLEKKARELKFRKIEETFG
ncbi:MAG: KH domain-containing protein [Thermoplasmata archaeon]